MGFRLGLAQCTHPANGDVIALARSWMQAATEAHVDLLVFPEAFMGSYDEAARRYRTDPEPLDGPFARAIDALAAEFGLWVVYTLNEQNPAGALPYNTAVITDATGSQRAAYRKVHLFDAQGYRESDRLSAGNELFAPLETPFGTVGLAICYDLRFPEVARAAALRGCQVMLYPSAWVSGQRKIAQWETLLAARAIENGLFVAGVSRADVGYVGSSRIFAPDGELLASGARTPWADTPKSALSATPAQAPDEESETLIVANIDLARIDAVRTATPSLAHLRPDTY